MWCPLLRVEASVKSTFVFKAAGVWLYLRAGANGQFVIKQYEWNMAKSAPERKGHSLPDLSSVSMETCIYRTDKPKSACKTILYIRKLT